jgi:hypothetical protein
LILPYTLEAFHVCFRSKENSKSVPLLHTTLSSEQHFIVMRWSILRLNWHLMSSIFFLIWMSIRQKVVCYCIQSYTRQLCVQKLISNILFPWPVWLMELQWQIVVFLFLFCLQKRIKMIFFYLRVWKEAIGKGTATISH